MTRPVRNLQASVLDRLRNHARKNRLTFNEVLTYYGLERFLYRISESPYRKDFILKGALLMSTWRGMPLRTTRDLDLRARLQPEAHEVLQVMQEICTVEVKPDGLVFDPENISARTIVERAPHPALRIRLSGNIGNVKVPIRVDMSFSDPMFPAPAELDYPTLLDLPAPRIRGYRPETVVAEKLESMVEHGDLNTRMKDFYDVWQISRIFSFEGESLVSALRLTFQARGTSFPADPTGILGETFALQHQDTWKAFLNRIRQRAEGLPEIADVLDDLKPFLYPAIIAARDETAFPMAWDVERGWS